MLAFPLTLCALVATGIIGSLYVYSQVDRAGRVHILDRVSTIATAVPSEGLRMLSGSEDDQGMPAYESLKTLLGRMRAVNHDARFLYVIGQRPDGRLFFYADSEPAESPDYSPPGQVYFEATPIMYGVFEDGIAKSEGPERDRWGMWISGYAPVIDESGRVVAILGMDLPANRFILDTIAYALLPPLASLVLIVIVMAFERARRQQLAHIEQKAEFLSIASHEIRTPLTGIRWAIEGLLSRENPPINPKTRTVLVLVHESCLGLIGRVNNLLDLSKLEGQGAPRAALEAIAIPTFFKDIADSLALSAQQRDVRVELDDSVARAGSFMADRQMMHHAFFNLLTNAIKYTHLGTTVSVSYAYAGDVHVFRVSDQGEGVPTSDQERIFAGYYRTKEAIRSGQYGSGLGLYLAKKAAELHDGTIRVASVPGTGATFIIAIPAAPTLSRSSR